ncbi:MAG: hypothetical protein V8T10_00685 [Merdibacter sp.]
MSTAYLTLLGILIFFLLVQCVRSTHRLSLWLTLINIAMQFPFCHPDAGRCADHLHDAAADRAVWGTR